MLTDIFADRYSSRTLWESVGESESRLLVQGIRIVSEQLIPYWHEGKEDPAAKTKWTTIHSKLSMELGLTELAPRYYSYQTTWNGQPHTSSGFWTMDKVCSDFVLAKFQPPKSADRFMKERISFIEIAFREEESVIRARLLDLDRQIEAARIAPPNPLKGGLRVPGNRVDGLSAWQKTIHNGFQACVEELNERFRQARAPLNYHNGFIQISDDQVIEEQIESPFWGILENPLWKNVDIDMKEAIDRRDGGDRDPAFYAARALESTIKIISDVKGWTHGGEKGAHNFIDNLGSKKSGPFIEEWEKQALKDFFTAVRNPFGHGPGSKEMPELSPQQTNWAIESCMSWVKTLSQRI